MSAAKTYVLIGYDSEKEYKEYKKREDCIIIRYDDPRYKTFEEAIRTIKPPGNIILGAHGVNNGTFRWRKDETRRSYKELFSLLPRVGIASVTLGSCCGGTSQVESMLAAAPPGMLVQSMTGPTMSSIESFAVKFAEESKGLTRPIDLFLEALDNFDPEYYKKLIERLNKQNGTNSDSDPDKAMPHILGLGGNPPKRINLADELKTLKGKGGDPAFARAIKHVQERFDARFNKFDKKYGKEDEEELDARIVTMANKLSQGHAPANVEEKQLAYAITAAYLDESGTLQHLIQNQQSPRRDASGKQMTGAAWQRAAAAYKTYAPTWLGGDSEKELSNEKKLCDTGEGQKPCLSPNELAYMESITKKLHKDPKAAAINNALTSAFSQSAGNDSFPENCPLNNTLKQKGISTKTWTH